MKALAKASIALLLALAPAAVGAPVRSPHVTTELVAQTAAAAPGSTIWLAVSQTLDKGWHTYWRNPGDAGEAPTIRWILPAGWKTGDIVWPTPHRLPVGPIMNYGYEDQVLLAVPAQVPADARPGSTATVSAAVDYLVCAEVCVPGSATVSLDLPVTAATPAPDPDWAGPIARTLAQAPKPGALTATFLKTATALTLSVAGPGLAGAAARDVYFYPFSDSLIDHAAPQKVAQGAGGLTLTLAPGPAFKSGAGPAVAAGVLAVDGVGQEISAAPGPPPAGAAPIAGLDGGASGAGGGAVALAGAMGFALLGGLILNLMPCVFPVLSMKAAGLAGHAADGRARAGGLAFLAGVLATFLTLAGLLIAARAAGAAVGWGFQLQSPLVVALLCLVMLLAALNLSGVFEIGTSAQGIGAGLAARGDLIGSAFTGVLAVVVAAPCTAPFMGPALGYALTQPPAITLAVFLALGVGFAAPFTALAFTPGLLRRLPRPGAWMDVFRKAMAFPMYAAAAWLAWVLARQAGEDGLARLLAAGVAVALAAWLYGLAQNRMARGVGARLPLGLAVVAAALGVGAVTAGAYPSPTPAAAGAPAPAGVLAAEPWSPARLAALRAEGRPVLVNFTAAWCVTCQVNERLAFNDPAVKAALARDRAVYLVGDWTNRDPAIAAALAEHGRIGVPLYLVYRPGAEAQVLPQLLTPAMVVQALAPARG